MNCPNVRQLAEYHEHLCSPGKSLRLSRHLDECPSCQQEMLALQRMAILLESMPAPCMPTDLWPGVSARIAAPPQRLFSPWVGKAAAGVTLATCLLVASHLLHRQPESLPASIMAVAPYITQHQLLSARDPLTDRASLVVQLSNGGTR